MHHGKNATNNYIEPNKGYFVDRDARAPGQETTCYLVNFIIYKIVFCLNELISPQQY
jgi:hypothetical protein